MSKKNAKQTANENEMFASAMESMMSAFFQQMSPQQNPFYNESLEAKMPTSIEELGSPQAFYRDPLSKKAFDELRECLTNLPEDKRNAEIKSLLSAFRFVHFLHGASFHAVCLFHFFQVLLTSMW
jgi:hypothetical protein